MRRFLAYGLVIESEIAILGAIALGPADGVPPDVCITYGKAAIGADVSVNGPYKLSGDRLLFEAPNAGKYLCTAGREIHVEPLPHATAEIVEGLLIATALPALLWQRGGIVLHAGAVVLPQFETAIAIAGPSGIGKSTVIDQLVRMNASLVGDDTIAFGPDLQSQEIKGLPASYFVPQPDSQERSLVSVPPDQIKTTAQLGAVVVVERHPEIERSAIVRLHGVVAVEALLKSRHRPRVPALLGREADVFQFCALLCARVPLYTWRRKDGDTAISDEELDALESCVKARE